MLSAPLNKEVKPSTKPLLPMGCHWFTLFAVEGYTLNSELPTQTHQLHHCSSRTSFSDTITSYRKTSVLLKLSNVTFAAIWNRFEILWHLKMYAVAFSLFKIFWFVLITLYYITRQKCEKRLRLTAIMLVPEAIHLNWSYVSRIPKIIKMELIRTSFVI